MGYILGSVFLSFLLGLLVIFSNRFKINPGKFSEEGAVPVTVCSAVLSGGIVACLMWYFLR